VWASAERRVKGSITGADAHFRDKHGSVEEIAIDGDYVIEPVSSLRDAAVAGLGPALLNDFLIDAELERGQLVDVFPRHAVTATTFDTAAWLVYPSRSYLPGKVRAMIDFLRANLT
jgi:DNA-binding transcriptional LysR family regulator